MARIRIPLRSTVETAAGLSAPPVVIAVVLGLAGEMSWLGVVAIAIGTLGVIVPLAVRHRRGLARIADHADAAVGREPETATGGRLRDVAAAVGRLSRSAADQLRRADHTAAANAMIIENLPEPLLLLAEDGTILGANIAARGAFGARLTGHDVSEAIRAPALLDAVAEVLGGEPKREVEFEQPVPVVRTFNAIIERLPSNEDRASAADGPRAVAMVLIHDLTAVKRTETLRAEFVANVSHELRTPLSAMVGFIETLATSAKDDPAARERFLGLMGEQGRRMSRLIEDLLSLSKIEMDEHTRPSDPVDLGARARAVVQALAQRAEQRGITLVVEAQADPACIVVGESDQIYEVIENLVENAIRYSRNDSTVTIAIWRADAAADDAAARHGSVGMAVRDQGEGIAREHLPRITERFYRVDRARSRAMGGTGLGLAIVKHIVSRHRAALQIESKVGEGSVFTVYWPAADPAGAGEAKQRAMA